MKYEEYSDDFYREEGIAIYVKGKLIVGLHPMDLEQKLKKLDSDEMEFNWQGLTNKDIPIYRIKRK